MPPRRFMTTPEFPRTSGKHKQASPRTRSTQTPCVGMLAFQPDHLYYPRTNKSHANNTHTRRKKTNIMNWRMLLLVAFLLPLPTGLAAQKKKKEKEKAEQPKIEMTFQEKIKPFGPPPIREKEPNEKDENHSAEYMTDCLQQEDTRKGTIDQAYCICG